MFTLRFKTKKQEAETQCEREVALLAASTTAGVELTHRCGGHARCGTCVVTVLSGADQLSEPLASEKRILTILKATPDQRLACQAWAKGDVSCEAKA
ncbi:MAG TPA: 2Fe-2S iron-sulfur cluster-binding protein [Holophagaceae bacterium]|nr:2Fe-2S iron-sulfur cluster-binding protein [Holophagaceae bacterium]